MPRVQVYIGVGSNIDPCENIPEAAGRLARKASTLQVSNFYRSPAIDRPELPNFINGVFAFDTELDPQSLKDVLLSIEEDLGRVRGDDPYGSRTVDLDILLYGAAVLQTEGLTIPDPDIRTRAFIAVPLLELAPRLVLPDDKVPLGDLAITKQTETIEEVPELRAKVLARITA